MIGISKNRLIDIALLQFAIFILSLTGIAAKKASIYQFWSVEFISLYIMVLLIIGVYAIAWQQLLKRFELTVAYFNKSTLIIWTFLWAILIFHETISVNNILGAVLVILGIILVLRDDK